MALPDPVSTIAGIFKGIYDAGNTFVQLLGTIEENRKECEWLLCHISQASEIVKAQEQMSDGNYHRILSGPLNGLKEILEDGHKEILRGHEKKRGVMRAIRANEIAKTLSEIGEKISRQILLVMFAMMTVEKRDRIIKKSAAEAVQARGAAQLTSLSKQMLLEALPDLPHQVHKSVRIYCNSIPYASNQNNDKRQANNKTKVHHSSVKFFAENNNVAVDHRTSLASISYGTANKFASTKIVADGQGRPKVSLSPVAAPKGPSLFMVDSERMSIVPRLSMDITDSSMATRQNGGSAMATQLKGGSSIRGSTSFRHGSSTLYAMSTQQKGGSSIRENTSLRHTSSTLHGKEAAMATQQNGGSFIRHSRPTLYGNESATVTQKMQAHPSVRVGASTQASPLSMLHGNEAVMATRQNGGSSTSIRTRAP